MDDDFTSLEAELKQLQPTRPSARLEHALTQDLGCSARVLHTPGSQASARQTPYKPASTRRAWWRAAVALPIAAALAAGVFAWRQSAAKPNVLKPVTAENVLYAATDEGHVTLANGLPARRERLKFVDTITWQNPKTHASLTWTVPREEVRVVPVKYQ